MCVDCKVGVVVFLRFCCDVGLVLFVIRVVSAVCGG
jgi:hypothetical protein